MATVERAILCGSADVTDTVIVQCDGGWRINWDAVPPLQKVFSLNLLHKEFMRERPYTTKEDAARSLSEMLGLRPDAYPNWLHVANGDRPTTSTQEKGGEQ